MLELGSQTLTITGDNVFSIFTGSLQGTGALALTGTNEMFSDVAVGATPITVTGSGSGSRDYNDAAWQFTGHSTIGTGTLSVSNGGQIVFFDTSSAGSARIAANNGGLVGFEGSADAGASEITVNSGGPADAMADCKRCQCHRARWRWCHR